MSAIVDRAIFSQTPPKLECEAQMSYPACGCKAGQAEKALPRMLPNISTYTFLSLLIPTYTYLYGRPLEFHRSLVRSPQFGPMAESFGPLSSLPWLCRSVNHLLQLIYSLEPRRLTLTEQTCITKWRSGDIFSRV